MRPAVQRDDPGFVDHLVVNHHVPGRLEDLIPGVVRGGKKATRHATRDTSLPGGLVLPRVGDTGQVVVAFFFRPRHDRNPSARWIDDERSPWSQLPSGGVDGKAGRPRAAA